MNPQDVLTQQCDLQTHIIEPSDMDAVVLEEVVGEAVAVETPAVSGSQAEAGLQLD